MHFFLGAFALGLMFVIIFLELNRRSSAIFLWAGLVLFFGYSHIMQCSQWANSRYRNVLDEASFFVILFCIMYIIGRIPFWVKNKKNFSLDMYDNNMKMTNIMYYLLIIVTIILFIFLLFTASAFSDISKEIVYINRSGTRGQFVNVFTLIWILGANILSVCLIYKQKKKAVIVTILIVSYAFITSTRSYLLIAAVSYAIFLLYAEKLTFKKVLWLSMLVFGGIYIMLLLRVFRYYYSFKDILSISLFDIHQKNIYLLNQESGDFFVNYYFYKLLDLRNNVDGLGEWASFFRILLLPIPSALTFGLKPNDFCITLGQILGNSTGKVVQLTLTPTLFGDCYGNFGYLGILFGSVWALIVSFFDSFIKRATGNSKIILFSSVSCAYVNIARGDVYNALAGVYYSFLMLLCLDFVCNRVRFRIGRKK